MKKELLNEIKLIKKRMGLILTEGIVDDWAKEVIDKVLIGFPNLLTTEDQTLLKAYFDGTINSADQKLVDEIFKTQKGEIASQYMEDMVKSLERQKVSGGLTYLEIREIETAIRNINSKKADLDSLIALHTSPTTHGSQSGQNSPQFDLLSLRQKVLSSPKVAKLWSNLDKSTQVSIENYMRLHWGSKTESQIIKESQQWIKDEIKNIEKSKLSSIQKEKRIEMLKDTLIWIVDNKWKAVGLFAAAMLASGIYKVADFFGIAPELPKFGKENNSLPSPSPSPEPLPSQQGNGQGW